ncbi:MAG: hypothetical protein KGO94_07740 [Alphaproteobacteria bacterium]|nr:hypothetical protein [Alphaproteobacteria bacterium]
MKFSRKNMVMLLSAIALGGCSTAGSLLDPKSQVPQATNVQVGNALAMPPDLALAQPGQTTDAYIPNGPVAPADQTGLSKPVKQAAAKTPIAPIPVKQDLYDQYGVAKTNPDGTPRDRNVMQEELKAAMLKKKREKNPGYGTIANIGAIFQDQ